MSGSDTFICHPSHLRVNFLLCSFCFFFLCVCLFIYTHINTHIYTYIYTQLLELWSMSPPAETESPACLTCAQDTKCQVQHFCCFLPLHPPCFKCHTCTCPCTQPLYEHTIHEKHRLAKHCNFQEQVLVGNTAQLHFFYLVGATQVSSACRRWKLIIPKQRKKTTKQNTKLFLSFR